MAEKKAAAKKAAVKKAPAVKETAAVKAPAKKTDAKTTAAMPRTPEPTHAAIAELAHKFWQERGSRHGSHDDDWARAERELRGAK